MDITIRGIQYRKASFSKEDINTEDRSITLSFSSDARIVRGNYIEVLDHNKGAVRLNRINTSAPLLLNHDIHKQIGRVDKATIENNSKGKAVVRFSKSTLGQEIYQDVVDGIRDGVSVGYVIHKAVNDGTDAKSGLPVLRAIDWEPMEISIVSTPADFSVGVGRQQEVPETIIIRNEDIKKMDEKEIMEQAIKTEKERVSDIMAVSRQWKLNDIGDKAISDGMPADEFRKLAMAELSKRSAPTSINDAELGMTKKEVNRYSITRAINASIENRWDMAPFEREVSREVEKRFGKPAKGFYIPVDVLRRDVDYATEKGDVVSTKLDTGNFIDLLFSKLVVRNLGALFLEGIVGNIDIPRMSGGATVYWQSAENTAVTESTPAFDKVSLSPKSMGAIVDVSKLLLNQSSLSVDSLILNDMARALAIGLDRACIYGAGSGSNEPEGILTQSVQNGNITTSTGLTYADIVKMETLLSTENADEGAIAYLTNPKVRGKLKQIFTNATYGSIPVWQTERNGEGIVNGYRALASTIVPSTYNTNYSPIIFGNFRDLIVAIFAPGLDVTIDPYSGAKNRLVSLVNYMDVDVGIRHLKSFVAAKNVNSNNL